MPINTILDKTPLAFADHGRVSGALPVDGGDAEPVIDEFRRRRVDDAALADQFQVEGVQTFDKAWHDLLDCIAEKREALIPAAPGRS
jgi:transaldolase